MLPRRVSDVSGVVSQHGRGFPLAQTSGNRPGQQEVLEGDLPIGACTHQVNLSCRRDLLGDRGNIDETGNQDTCGLLAMIHGPSSIGSREQDGSRFYLGRKVFGWRVSQVKSCDLFASAFTPQ